MTIEIEDSRGRKRTLDYRNPNRLGLPVMVAGVENSPHLWEKFSWRNDTVYRAWPISEDDLEVTTANPEEKVIFSREMINKSYFFNLDMMGSIRWRETKPGDYPEAIEMSQHKSTQDADYRRTYMSLPKDRRRDILRQGNIVIYARDLFDERMLLEIDRNREMGVRIVSLLDIAYNVINLADQRGTKLIDFDPSVYQSGKSKQAKKILTEQEKIISELVADIDLQISDGRVLFKEGEELITLSAEEIQKNRDRLEMLFRNTKYAKVARNLLEKLLSHSEGVVAVADRDVVYDDALTFAVGYINAKTDFRVSRVIDRLPTADKPSLVLPKIRSEAVRRAALVNRRDELEKAIVDGEIKLVPRLNNSEVPTHPIINYLRDITRDIIEEEVRLAGLICDPEDIRFQTISRLTTYSVSDIFVNGFILEDHLQTTGAAYDWRRLADLDESLIRSLSINEDLLRETVREQMVVIADRLSNSAVALDVFLYPENRYDKAEWTILRTKEGIFALNRASQERVPVEFHQVNPPEVAEVIHDKLHYIHNGRADWAFGLAMKDESWPFSIIGVAQIDRLYKQNALIAMGFDPYRWLDLTRLYNRPGTPLNSSSAIMSLTHEYFKRDFGLQGMLSAFMPSFASGHSMLSAGYREPLIMKTGDQMFQEREIGGKNVMVKVTKRDLNPRLTVVHSKIPMIPTFEFFLPFVGPRFRPLPQMDGMMVDLT